MTDAATRGLRVLMPTPLYVPNLGGVERFVDVLARRLAERGVDVTVLTTDPSRTLPAREEAGGVQILRVPAWPRGRDWLLAPDVYRVVARGGWDVVHVHSFHTFVAPLAMSGALRAGLPYALTFHGGGHSSALRRALRRPQMTALRPLLARADRLVAIARFEIEHYGRALRLPAEHFALIPVGTNVAAAPPRTAGRRNGTLIASVGRLERYKGHHRLIEALPEILRQVPGARVWIAGSGPYEAALKRQAAELGVAARVDIRAVPADRPGEMASELGKAALVVLLSDHETQPQALLEALAQRIPVLVTHSTGLAELAEQGLARSVAPGSGPREVAAAVVQQLRDPYVPERLDLPSWDECVERHHALYLELLAARRNASAAITASGAP